MARTVAGRLRGTSPQTPTRRVFYRPKRNDGGHGDEDYAPKQTAINKRTYSGYIVASSPRPVPSPLGTNTHRHLFGILQTPSAPHVTAPYPNTHGTSPATHSILPSHSFPSSSRGT